MQPTTLIRKAIFAQEKLKKKKAAEGESKNTLVQATIEEQIHDWQIAAHI